MEKEFVPYELALRLKALGFDEPCLDYFANSNPQNSWTISYNSDDLHRPFESVARPTFSQAFRWFIENYGLWFRPDYYDDLKEYNFQGNIHKLGNFSSLADIGNYSTCEEAELACLEKIIEIVESENK